MMIEIVEKLLTHCSAMNKLIEALQENELMEADMQASFELITEINTIEIQIHELRQMIEAYRSKL